MKLKRQTQGSVVCPSCRRLVGVGEPNCPYCGRSKPGMWGFGPQLQRLGGDLGFEKVAIAACAALYLFTLAVDTSWIEGGGMMSLLSPSRRALFLFGASGPLPVFGLDRWWTVLSAGWLHGGLLHILFNMMWVRQLAPETRAIYGSSRTVIIYVLSSVAGFVLSSVGGAYLGIFRWLLGGSPGSITVGASAAIFGLLGATVYAGRRGIATHLASRAWTYAVVLFIFGFLMRGVDNWAHLGGFLGGYFIARWLDPQTPEKPDHSMAAIACLVASALAVLMSVVTSF